MMPMILSFLVFFLIFGGSAQAYPTKVVRFIVSFSPGSGSDTVGRIIAQGLSQSFGQQVIVENRAGAAGNIGAEIASRAPADGYNLFLVNLGHAASASLYNNLPYNLMRDFAPVVQFVTSPSVVVVHPSVPVKTLADLVKMAKAKPGALNYGSGGIGTPTFVAGELFKMMAGVDMMHVPYKSGGEAITAIVSGETSVYFAPFAVALPHIREKRLVPLAVTSTRRVPLLPDYPTVAESGYPGYQAGNWYGIMVPVKTPKETIALIRNAALKALKSPEIAKRLADLGYISIGDTPEEFAAHIKSEIDSLAKLLKGYEMPFKR
ncbi:MAG: tripartite tricarboxylate transporter substrate binding protein [Thermodesulfobacteriota bacterium]